MLNKRIRVTVKLLLLAATVGLIPLAQAAGSQTFVATPDAVKIAVQEYGNPEGPEIVLVHGLLGSHLTWAKQVQSPLLRKYRLITYDLRGHGLSGKPTGPRYYQDGKRWGDELNAVIAAKRLKRPVLVGWSLGALALTNYVHTYGTKGIAGLVDVGPVIELKPELVGQHPTTTTALHSSDLASHLEGTRQFVRYCFDRMPDSATFNQLVASAAMAAPEMSRAVFGGISSPARTTLPKVKVPILIFYGERDVLVKPEMIELGHRLMPKAQILRYKNSGHSPFYEEADRFNSDLARFSDISNQKK